MRPPLYASLDEALETLASCGIALDSGNSSHAPMVACPAAIDHAHALLRPRQTAPGANPAARTR